MFAVNKQLNDKERVAAALENPNLVDMVDECLAPSFDWRNFFPPNSTTLCVLLYLMPVVVQLYLYDIFVLDCWGHICHAICAYYM